MCLLFYSGRNNWDSWLVSGLLIQTFCVLCSFPRTSDFLKASSCSVPISPHLIPKSLISGFWPPVLVTGFSWLTWQMSGSTSLFFFLLLSLTPQQHLIMFNTLYLGVSCLRFHDVIPSYFCPSLTLQSLSLISCLLQISGIWLSTPRIYAFFLTTVCLWHLLVSCGSNNTLVNVSQVWVSRLWTLAPTPGPSLPYITWTVHPVLW